MVDFFVNTSKRDEELACSAHPRGDIDMIISPVDGRLVVVAQVDGVHVCGFCHRQYVNDPSHPFRPVEWNPPDGQGTRLLLHSCCTGPAKSQGGSVFYDLIRGHQAKRFVTQAILGIKDILHGG